jgi:hypothetical protein
VRILVGLALLSLGLACGRREQAPADLSGPVRGETHPAKLGRLPEDAAIVFTSMRWRDDPHAFTNWELFARDLAGVHVAQLSFDGQSHQHAAVAPDHRHVATNRMPREPWNDLELWVLDLEAQTETRFAPSFQSAGNGGVDWGPDGWLYFAARPTKHDSFDLFRARLDGSAIEQLTRTPEDDYDVSVSADGKQIAWVRVQGRTPFFRKTEIWVANADGTAPLRVYDGGPKFGRNGGFPLGGYDPEFAPDGRSVVFSHTDEEHDNFGMGAQDLWVGATDGSGVHAVHEPTGALRMIPDWRDDLLLFTEFNQFDQYVGLATMRPDGSDVRRLDAGLRDVWDGGRHGKFVPPLDPQWPHATESTP